MPKSRVVQVGPKGIAIASGTTLRLFYDLPAGGVLTYINLAIRVAGAYVPKCECVAVVYREEHIAQGGYMEIHRGYVSRSIARCTAFRWQGEFEIPDDYGYTLELEMRNYTSMALNVDGTIIVKDGGNKNE